MIRCLLRFYPTTEERSAASSENHNSPFALAVETDRGVNAAAGRAHSVRRQLDERHSRHVRPRPPQEHGGSGAPAGRRSSTRAARNRIARGAVGPLGRSSAAPAQLQLVRENARPKSGHCPRRSHPGVRSPNYKRQARLLTATKPEEVKGVQNDFKSQDLPILLYSSCPISFFPCPIIAPN